MEKIKILVVDDESIVIESVMRHLKYEAQYELSSSVSAKSAVEMLEKENFDIVITDLMMPEMDGMEFLSWLRDNSRRCLALMITGYATISTALKATQLGAFDYIAKPFTREELRKVVKRAADLIKASDGAQLHTDFGGGIKKIGANTWMKKLADGKILLGAERKFVDEAGTIRTVYMPSEGDVLRQGCVYFQVFMADMSSKSLLSPLSGTVAEVNRLVAESPSKALSGGEQDGWLIKLEPSNEEDDIKILTGI